MGGERSGKDHPQMSQMVWERMRRIQSGEWYSKARQSLITCR